MKLDRSTYEAWLLDRIEGNLTPAQERELDAFLAVNPDLGADPGDLPALSGEAIGFVWKDELKKHYPPTGQPDIARIDDFLIARLEGDLDAERSVELDRLLYEHPELGRSAKLISATKSGNPGQRFEGKAGIVRHFPPEGMPDVHRLDDFLIAHLEGDLTLQQRTALDAMIVGDANVAKQWVMVQGTRVPRERVVYQGKEALRKKAGRVIGIGRGQWMRLAAAASIALVLGLGWMLLRNEGTEPGLASSSEPTVKEGPEQQLEPTKQGSQAGEPLPLEQPVQAQEGKASLPKEHVPNKDQNDRPLLPRHGKQQVPVIREREEAPAMAQARAVQPEYDVNNRLPTGVIVGPGMPPAPLEEALVATTVTERQTIGELLSNTVRREVLDSEPAMARALNGGDVVAAVDKGLAAISGDRAGVAVQRDLKRSRFRLHLGDLALSASTGR